jgi:hypothetical protein
LCVLQIPTDFLLYSLREVFEGGLKGIGVHASGCKGIRDIGDQIILHPSEIQVQIDDKGIRDPEALKRCIAFRIIHDQFLL